MYSGIPQAIILTVTGSGETVSRQAHNLEAAGSTPVSPTPCFADGGSTPRIARRAVREMADPHFAELKDGRGFCSPHAAVLF